MNNVSSRINAIPVRYAELAHGRVAYRDRVSGEPVILLHGIGSGSASWLLQFETLASNFRLIAWDAPGYGESSPLPVETPDVWDYVLVLRDLLEYLNVEKYHLVAHSLGALIAGAHCQPNSRLPESLTFIDPTLGYGAFSNEKRNTKVRDRLQTFKELGAVGLAKARGRALLSENAGDEALEIVEWNMKRLTDVGYRHAVQLLGNTDLLKELADVPVPTMVMCGTADDITPESVSKRLVDAYTGARYEPIKDSGHASYIEAANNVNDKLVKHFSTASRTKGDLR